MRALQMDRTMVLQMRPRLLEVEVIRKSRMRVAVIHTLPQLEEEENQRG